jgi:hypothetical protein
MNPWTWSLYHLTMCLVLTPCSHFSTASLSSSLLGSMAMGMVMPAASLASTIAGWHAAAALKSVSFCEDKFTILPPQQNPTMPKDVMFLFWLLISSMTLGIRPTVLGGAPVVSKNLPRRSPFSFCHGCQLSYVQRRV